MKFPAARTSYARARLNAIKAIVCITVIAFFGVTLFLTSSLMTDAPKAERLLLGQGYTDIKITGYRWFGCAEDELVKTGFVATDLKGNRTEGVVCSQLFFKGSTIRFD